MKTLVRARSLGLLAALAMLVALLPGGVGAQEFEGLTRLEASDNVAAAIAYSQATFADGAATEALLGRDDVFADSLASGGAQGATRPLLLTASDSIDQRVFDELERLGVETVTILGGTEAITEDAEQQLQDAGYATERRSGPSRIETAVDIAANEFIAPVTAILARSHPRDADGDPTQAFADSLAAGGWAADQGWPVLLTQTEELHPNTRAFLEGQGQSIREIFVVGGTQAVSEAVVAELEAMGRIVTRVSGPTRFDTAVAIANERGFATAQDASLVILVEGQADRAWASGFPAAAHSAAHDAPIVLANGEALPEPTEQFLSGSGDGAQTQGTSQTELVCGPYTTESACTQAAEALGLQPVATRATLTLDSTEVAPGGTLTGTITGEDIESVTVSGAGLSDQSVELGEDGSFSITIPQSTEPGDYTLTFTVTFTDEETEDLTAEITVTGGGPIGAVDAPELFRVTVVDANSDPVTLRFEFTQPITGNAPVPANFAIYGYDGTATEPSGTPAAAVDTNNTSSALVKFSQAAFNLATTAGVDVGAVFNAENNANPERAVPFQGVTLAAGRTQAPDLTAVAVTSNTMATFTFDQTVANEPAPGGFTLVLQDGSTRTGTAATVGGTDRTVVTVTFDEFNVNDVRRGVVAAGTASTATDGSCTGDNRCNPRHAESVDTGITTRPDLVAVSLDPEATSSTGSAVDRALYVFDADLPPGPLCCAPGNNFTVYRHNAAEVSASGQRSSDDARTVVVDFPNNTFDTGVNGGVVGASVAANAVVDNSGTFNNPGEFGIERQYSTDRTYGPDLVSVKRELTDGTEANPTQYRLTLTFDEAVQGSSVQIDDFFVVAEDGTRTVLTSGSTSTSGSEVTITVTSGTHASFPAVRDAVLLGVRDQRINSARGRPNPGDSAIL